MADEAGKNVREWVPWGLAAGRAALGPVLIAGAGCSWSPLALAGIVVTALVSDIFDGVLARRWGSDTAGLRLFDSMADTIFYLCTAVALWVSRPEVLRSNGMLLGVLLGLEAVRAVFDLAKFGKMASYHSYLAKTWGLVMAVAVTAVFANGRANALVQVALGLGIACNLEGLAMSLVLRVWRRDVQWIGAALRISTILAICCAISSSAQVAPSVACSTNFQVLVLDALSGKPQADVTIPYLCDEIPHSIDTKVTTDAKGFALVPFTCKRGNKIELDAVPKIGKEGCGGGVGATLEEIISRGVVAHPDSSGGIWCPTKISQKLTPTPGQVTLFVKKPTWWQSHIAG